MFYLYTLVTLNIMFTRWDKINLLIYYYLCVCSWNVYSFKYFVYFANSFNIGFWVSNSRVSLNFSSFKLRWFFSFNFDFQPFCLLDFLSHDLKIPLNLAQSSHFSIQVQSVLTIFKCPRIQSQFTSQRKVRGNFFLSLDHSLLSILIISL